MWLLRRKTSEQIEIPGASWLTPLKGSLRTIRAGLSGLRTTFWHRAPAYENTRVHYDVARALYRNDASDANLGSGFCKPVIDVQVEFIGLPQAASGDEIYDDFLNSTVEEFWASVVPQVFRNALRDSKVVVRLRRPQIADPLVTPEEVESGYIETIAPERCEFFYAQGGTSPRVDKVLISHEVEVIVEEATMNGRAYVPPKIEVHQIIEEITPTNYRYFDETEGKELTELASSNSAGFAPVVEIYNEFDITLKGGQSDLEAVYPFVRAFHDVLGQSLVAHKSHSVPKAVFKVHDVMKFIANNFPDSFSERDEFGNVVPSSFTGQVSWKGLEIIFVAADEGVEFLEAKSVLGDSKELLLFLLDCICIASQTPRSAFMLDVGASDRNEMLPFVRKIERKRLMFQDGIQMLFKMILALNRMEPRRIKLAWPVIREEDYTARMQAFQFKVMGLEVLKQSGIISDETYRAEVRSDLSFMKSPSDEARLAKDNVFPALAAPNSQQVAVTQGTQGNNE